jgi:hypothetical protein
MILLQVSKSYNCNTHNFSIILVSGLFPPISGISYIFCVLDHLFEHLSMVISKYVCEYGVVKKYYQFSEIVNYLLYVMFHILFSESLHKLCLYILHWCITSINECLLAHTVNDLWLLVKLF